MALDFFFAIVLVALCVDAGIQNRKTTHRVEKRNNFEEHHLGLYGACYVHGNDFGGARVVEQFE